MFNYLMLLALLIYQQNDWVIPQEMDSLFIHGLNKQQENVNYRALGNKDDE